MPTYDYLCESCNASTEIFHAMFDDSPRMCPECNHEMTKLISAGYALIHPANPQSQLQKDIKEREERAKDLRNKPVSRSHAGTGSGKGKALGGQHMEIDKQEFIKAAAKDPLIVEQCKKALKKSKS